MKFISIPLWCDWSPTKKIAILFIYFFISIPLWCDWSKRTEVNTTSELDISIPLWCDWSIKFQNEYIRCLLFQFRYGAIGVNTGVAQKITPLNFNSVMVRLECVSSERVTIITSFDFNSVMVRLELNSEEWIEAAKKVFQFRYGAIGVQGEYMREAGFRIFQFRYGAIGVESSNYWATNACWISIPLWCDWSNNQQNWFSKLQNISIPLWCDWSLKELHLQNN